MTEEYKDLLIKDLYTRLPYGVKSQNRWIDINKNEYLYIDKIKWIDENYIRTDGEGKYYFLERVKPILFPLSAINQEIEVNGEKVKIYSIVDNNFEHRFFIDNDGDISIEGDNASYIYLHEYIFILDTFNRYHIDYRGLIDKGLAISVYDLPENPYK